MHVKNKMKIETQITEICPWKMEVIDFYAFQIWLVYIQTQRIRIFRYYMES